MKSGNDPQSELSMPGSSARVPDMAGERQRTTRERFPPKRWASGTIRVTGRFSAPPERVFDAWLDVKVAGRWLFATASRPMTDVEIDPRVAGSFRLANGCGGELTEYRGQFMEIARARRLVFNLSLNGLTVITRVTVEIVPLSKGSCLTLTHQNVPHDRRNYLEQRWTGILYGLGVALSDPKCPP